MKRTLPRRVYERHGAWYHVAPDGKWTKLCRVKEGLAAMYRALAAVTDTAAGTELMPSVIMRWLESRRGDWSRGVVRDQTRIAGQIAKRFAQHAPAQMTAVLCRKYLERLLDKPRTHNMHRTMLIEVLSFAAADGLREGHNPATDTKALKMKPRVRVVDDDEIEALRKSALELGEPCAAVPLMLELALLTGQRISDIIGITWDDVTADGVLIVQEKTGARLLIEWSPALRAAVDACAQKWGSAGHLLKSASGKGWSYAGIWKQFNLARKAAGIEGLHIHDLRGRAGVDALLANGEDVRAAQRLLGHKGEAMTRRYTDGKYHRRAKPPR